MVDIESFKEELSRRTHDAISSSIDAEISKLRPITVLDAHTIFSSDGFYIVQGHILEKARRARVENDKIREKLERAAREKSTEGPLMRSSHDPRHEASKGPVASPAARSAAFADATPPPKDHDLLKQLHERQESYEKLKAAHQQVVEKCRMLKNNCRSWQAYHDKMIARLKKQNYPSTSPESNKTSLRGSGKRQSDASSPLERSEPPVRQLSSAALSPFASLDDTSNYSIPKSNRGNCSPSTTSKTFPAAGAQANTRDVNGDQVIIGSQSGSAEPREAPSVALNVSPVTKRRESQDDEPEFVSERPVKKRRMRQTSVPAYDLTKIKDEPHSLTPKSDRAYITFHDSLDLDEIGQRIVTPRKARQEREAMLDGQSSSRHVDDFNKTLDLNLRRGYDNRARMHDLDSKRRTDRGSMNDGQDQRRERNSALGVISPNIRVSEGIGPAIGIMGRCHGEYMPTGELESNILGDKAPKNRAPDPGAALSGSNSLEEPLRSRPPHRLTLEDFKINADATAGIQYAYSSVVRKQNERRCLPNCTKSECCGDKFQKMVKIGGFPPTCGRVSRSLMSAESQEDDDRRVLEAYLGPDFRSLGPLDLEAREELLMRARAAQLGNQYGRHRNLFERPTSPPGFWQTDMPSTQEIEENQEAGRKADRMRVEERYREAIKPHGRWKFRDE